MEDLLKEFGERHLEKFLEVFLEEFLNEVLEEFVENILKDLLDLYKTIPGRYPEGISGENLEGISFKIRQFLV